MSTILARSGGTIPMAAFVAKIWDVDYSSRVMATFLRDKERFR